MCALLSAQSPTLELIIRRHQTGQHYLDLRLRGMLLTTQIFHGRPPMLDLNLDEHRYANQDPQDYGNLLSALLFGHPGVAAGFRDAVIIAEQHGHPLRVSLQLDSDDEVAHSIPWELLRIPEDDAFLSTRDNIRFARSYASRHRAPLMRRPRGELTAAIGVAAPIDLDAYELTALDGPVELARLIEAMGPIHAVPVARLGQGERTTRKRLADALAQLPDILLLLCHGRLDPEDGEPTLFLEDDAGKTARLQGKEFVDALAGSRRWPTLIVLVACETGGDNSGRLALTALGPRLVEAGCPAVIAAQGKLSLATAVNFFQRFFAELCQDGQIERALAAARRSCQSLDGWWRPSLYTCLEDGLLWRPSPGGDVFSGVPDTLAHFVGREEEQHTLHEALCVRLPAPPIVSVTGGAGLGKTALVARTIAKLRQDGLLPEVVLWGTLGGHRPDEILSAFLADLGVDLGPGAATGPTLPRLREAFWERMRTDRRVFVLVLDNIEHADQLCQLIPDDVPATCRLILIGPAPVANEFRRQVISIVVKPLAPEESDALFLRVLGEAIVRRYKHALDDLAGRLGGHTYLLAAAALYLRQSGETPDAYCVRLGDDEAHGADEASLWIPLAHSLRDLPQEQRLALALIGLSGEGAWSAPFVAACQLRPIEDAESTLSALVARDLLGIDQGRRYRAHAITRVLAQNLLRELPAAQRGQLAYLFARSCLDLAADQILGSPDGPPGDRQGRVRRFRSELVHMLPHLRRALVLAEQYPEWRLFSRFARCSRLELVDELVCNAPEVRATLLLAHLRRPVFWAVGEQVRVRATAVMLSHEIVIDCGDPEGTLYLADAELHADGFAWPPLAQGVRPQGRPELSLTLTACRVEEGVFRGYAMIGSVWSGVHAPGLILADLDLMGARWRQCELRGSVWQGCDARRAELTRCDLAASRIEHVRLSDASLSGVDLRGADLRAVDLRGVDLSGAQLQGARLECVDLRGANLRRTQLDGARLVDVRLEGCAIEGSSWRGAAAHAVTADAAALALIIDQEGAVPRGGPEQAPISPGRRIVDQPDSDYAGADLRAVELPQADVALPAPRRLSLEGADLRAANLAGARLPRAALRGARLAAADLKAAHLEHADLAGADLLGACLERADAPRARLVGASLRYALLGRADLRGADLRGADLRGADLRRTDLRGADLRGADLRGADLRQVRATPRQLATAGDLRDAIVWYHNGGWLVEQWTGSITRSDFHAESGFRYHTFAGTYTETSFVRFNLLGVTLSGRFMRCDLGQARITCGRLSGTFLKTSFVGANLEGARLDGAFDDVNFTGANLAGCTISGVIVGGQIAGANLAGADLSGAALVNVDLQHCHGLKLEQLRQADSLRGSVVPVGIPPVAALGLPGDRAAAALHKIDPEDPEAFAVFCNGAAAAADLWRLRSVS